MSTPSPLTSEGNRPPSRPAPRRAGICACGKARTQQQNGNKHNLLCAACHKKARIALQRQCAPESKLRASQLLSKRWLRMARLFSASRGDISRAALWEVKYSGMNGDVHGVAAVRELPYINGSNGKAPAKKEVAPRPQKNLFASSRKAPYIDTILEISAKRLSDFMDGGQRAELMKRVAHLRDEGLSSRQQIDAFCSLYTVYCKELRQQKYTGWSKKLSDWLDATTADKINIIWGDCLQAMRKMPSESLQLMVTSPPYYNAREYSQWDTLDDYLHDMEVIVRESYRVLDNHRAFVFNVGDITGNDHRTTRSSWGNRRIPLGAYFVNIFEKSGFTFVDDFIWDKGQVESQRHKNGDTPYPLYQYPMNAYEHIMVFIKHELDPMPYPCPVCGCLNVNGNAFSGVGIKSWECKNRACFERSPADRGKRFGLRSVLMNNLKTDDNMLDADFVKKWRRDIVKINPVIKINSHGENKLGHTAPFPKEIPEYAIKAFSGVGEKVYDPFAGSFTTAIEAHRLGRIGIGSELNKDEFFGAIMQKIRSECGIVTTKEVVI